MSTHTLIVTGAEDDHRYEIVCGGEDNACRLYLECGCPWDDDYPDDCPAKGTEHRAFEFGLGALDPGACFLRDADHLPDLIADHEPLASGRYKVDYDGCEWDDLALTLAAHPADHGAGAAGDGG